ncbi:hypothetical protein [Streptomyces sp. NBC_00102]|uniref:hypothetical protein n=1 Tax=Streptomyces sp. NBC_00102 TaxID=2975652 RepID=UPI002258B608|nr:hypothetical protein [Streptomyces sp. NBC_00102]MCX5395629.1 hypothetical protein [Streptomyces sp. NBC_00102]
MNADFQRDLIPRADALDLIGELNSLKDRLHDAAHQWTLLDESGHVLAAPSFTELFQHATDAQALSHDVLRLTADFARSPHHTTRAGHTVLKHLTTAVTMSLHAASQFSETAESALSLSRTTGPTNRHYLENSMVLNHATARAYLRRGSKSLRDAAKELDDHLGFQRFLGTLTLQGDRPAPPPPAPGGRHR